MRVDRRTFLKKGAMAGGALVGAGLGIRALAEASGDQPSQPATRPDRTAHRPAPARPNILVIVVDQMRFPQWFGAGAIGASLPPNLQRLRQGAVSFGHHYTASNDCSPARSAMLTGLHTHQTGCMITGGSTLDPGFPDVGHDAPRPRIPHALARQVARHPRRRPLDRADRRRSARALRLRRRHVPLARRRSRPGLAQGPAGRPPLQGMVRRRRRRRAVVHDRLVRQPSRHRVVVRVERPRAGRGQRAPHRRAPAPELRDPGRTHPPPQAASAALAAGHRRRLVRAGPLRGPGIGTRSG